MADAKFAIDYGKRNCKCQKCKQPIEKGLVRIAKLVPNIFSDDGGDMKQYHHPICLFESFKIARATTKIIEVCWKHRLFTSKKGKNTLLERVLMQEVQGVLE